MPPAARVTDMHICPMVTGIVPHVGGPILPPCEPTVLTGFLPQARITDLATCVGPPDIIVMGSFTVLVGMLPAARILDMTAHGGMIILGCFTVIIGDAGAPSPSAPSMPSMPMIMLPNGDLQFGDNIVISGTLDFQKKTVGNLAKLLCTPTGRDILKALQEGKHKTTLKELDMATAQKNGALAGPVDRAGSKDPKKGSDTTISYNPDLKDKYTDQDGNKVDVPIEATLGHEMIHAVHNSNGTNERDKPDPKEPGSNQEESRTIGINDHADEPMSENNLLKDMGAGYQRTDHDESVVTE